MESLAAVVNTGSPAELASYYNQKGVLKLFAGNPGPAKRDFVSAINADPYYPDPYLNLAFALRALGEDEAALSVCRAAEEKCRPGARGGGDPEAVLAKLLKCQEISLNSLGRKAAAGAIAARRSALEDKTAAELLK